MGGMRKRCRSGVAREEKIEEEEAVKSTGFEKSTVYNTR